MQEINNLTDRRFHAIESSVMERERINQGYQPTFQTMKAATDSIDNGCAQNTEPPFLDTHSIYVKASKKPIAGYFMFRKQDPALWSAEAQCLSGGQSTLRYAAPHEPPEDAIPEHVEIKQQIRVPEIQSMDDYIKHHYVQELIDGMIGDIKERSGTADSILEVFEDTFHVDRTLFWRRSRTELIALLKVRLDVCENKNGADAFQRYEYVADIFFDFSDEIEYKEISYRPYEKQAENRREKEYNDEMWALDSYLVPYAKKEKIEKRAWELHCTFFPEACLAPLCQENDESKGGRGECPSDPWLAKQREDERKEKALNEFSAFELARRMGLQIIHVAFYNKSSRKSFFNFHESREQVYEEGSNDDRKKVVWITIPADTIVINTLQQGADEGELSVFHECIHWYWHYLFYRLQALHNSDISNLQRKGKPKEDKGAAQHSLSCMEYQANRGKYALKMPLPVMRPLVDSLVAECVTGSQHEGWTLEKVARRIVEERRIRPYLTRARLIQMGLIGAKGILNFEDGRYITPFTFDHENGSGDRVFFIRRIEALEEFKSNPEFRKLLQSGDYVYAEGHICMNDPRYVMQTSNGLRLTSWANAHVDACCLRFVSVYEMNEFIEYEFGRLASDEEYNNHYVNFLNADGKNLSRAEQVQANHQYVLSLPGNFFEMLDMIRKDRGLSQEKLEEKSHVSAKKLSREKRKLKEKLKMNLSLDEVVALCIGLEAPPWLSKAILAHANITLNPADSLHNIYEYVLSCMFMDGIEQVQKFLMGNGFPELELCKSEQYCEEAI